MMREATPDELRLLVPILGIGIPVFFVVLWVVITTAIVAASGWGRLQRRFPAHDDAARLTLTRQTGTMGVSTLKQVLTLQACPLGLRVSMTPLIGPFKKPFEVPWGEIAVSEATPFHGPRVMLRLGDTGSLAILASSWEQLSARQIA